MLEQPVQPDPRNWKALPFLALFSLGGMLAALGGCRNPAYSDLYIENMAAEIRDLEDQLYEFDYEYRQLEHELASLRAENSRLRDTRSSLGGGSSVPEAISGEPQSIMEPAVELPEDLSTDDLLAPIDETAPGSDSLDPTPEDDSPSLPMRSDPTAPEFDADELLPPTIEPGEPMPPQQPLGATRSTDDRSAKNALELNLSRIEVPTRLASQVVPDPESNTPETIDETPSDVGMELIQSGTATIKPAVTQIEDQRVVELAFHPTLSRAANFDDEPDDDGLYLVLQPLNEAGQMVPLAADLSVVILDPSRDGSQARIGRRDYSANEVKAKLQTAGTHQGIHLKMPWNGPDPGADRVLVFVRYTFPDGRQVIGEKTFFTTGEDGIRTVWAPRGSGSAEVTTASHTETSRNKGRRQSSVVRPAAGSSTAQFAPQPDADRR